VLEDASLSQPGAVGGRVVAVYDRHQADKVVLNATSAAISGYPCTAPAAACPSRW
jgi:hypothetical protein